MGRSRWEQGALSLRVLDKAPSVGCLLVAELSSPGACVSRRWIRFVRLVGWTRGMVLKSGRASECLRGLREAQVPGPPSGRGWEGIWAFGTFPGAAVKPGWRWAALQGKLLAKHR